MGCADEEARCKWLKAFGRMPLGSHLLPICFAIFGHGFPLLVGEPIKHVEENRVRVLHPDWFVRFANCLGNFCKENLGKGQIHRNNISSCFLSWAWVAFRLLCSLLEVQVEKSGIASTLSGNKKTQRVGFVCEERIEIWCRGTEQQVHSSQGGCLVCLQTLADVEHQIY